MVIFEHVDSDSRRPRTVAIGSGELPSEDLIMSEKFEEIVNEENYIGESEGDKLYSTEEHADLSFFPGRERTPNPFLERGMIIFFCFLQAGGAGEAL